MTDKPENIADSLAQNPVITLFARGMQIIVLPILVFLFMQLWSGLEQARTEFRNFDRRITVLESRLVDIDRRLSEPRR